MLTTLVGLDAAFVLALAIVRTKATASAVAALLLLLALVVGLGSGLTAIVVDEPALSNILVVPLAAATGAGLVVSMRAVVGHMISRSDEPNANSEPEPPAGQVQETTVSGNRVGRDMRVEPRQHR